MYPEHEVATVLKHQQDRLRALVPNSWKHRALFALMRCRTAAMGGHIDRCNEAGCHKLHMSYNSCRNRHCPKCQGQLKAQWIAARSADLLKSKYFHVVFTVPDTLHPIALTDPVLFYNALFKAAWQVMQGFGANPRFLGAQAGMIAVLHTWGQNLSLHPHLHCIVPAGGVTASGQWKQSLGKGKYLFPVKQMSKVFRAKLVSQLTKQQLITDPVRKTLFSRNWVIYAKQPFFGPGQVIEYLGRYTHKIAISNHRIKEIRKGQVTFSMKDYRKGGRKKVIKLSEVEFIRRFSLHILPKGFTKIRHYGILSGSSKKKYKALIDEQLGEVSQPKPTPTLHRTCPACKKGVLERVYSFDQRGPPANWRSLFEHLLS